MRPPSAPRAAREIPTTNKVYRYNSSGAPSWTRSRNEVGMSTATETDGSRPSFAEAALRLSGKTEEEARRTGAVDKADEQVEALFAPQYQTVNSPVHKAVWDGQVPLALFLPPPLPASAPCDASMHMSLEIVKRRRASGTLYNEEAKVSSETLQELAGAGYWG